MALSRKEKIACSFGDHADDYNRLGHVQREVAQRLAASLPRLTAPSILEVGCGTGFLTKHLYDIYPDASRFVLTDLSKSMLDFCQNSLPHYPRASFRVMDGEHPDIPGPFDLIISSMTIQWFDDPIAGIERLSKLLSPAGSFYFSTLGSDNFPEWHASVRATGEDSGLLHTPPLPGIFEEYRHTSHFKSALDFLRYLKLTGAQNPNPQYRSLTDKTLKQACRNLDQMYDAQISWHIVFGSVHSSFSKL